MFMQTTSSGNERIQVIYAKGIRVWVLEDSERAESKFNPGL
jgi:hypothetical protein